MNANIIELYECSTSIKSLPFCDEIGINLENIAAHNGKMFHKKLYVSLLSEGLLLELYSRHYNKKVSLDNLAEILSNIFEFPFTRTNMNHTHTAVKAKCQKLLRNKFLFTLMSYLLNFKNLPGLCAPGPVP